MRAFARLFGTSLGKAVLRMVVVAVVCVTIITFVGYIEFRNIIDQREM